MWFNSLLYGSGNKSWLNKLGDRMPSVNGEGQCPRLHFTRSGDCKSRIESWEMNSGHFEITTDSSCFNLQGDSPVVLYSAGEDSQNPSPLTTLNMPKISKEMFIIHFKTNVLKLST